MTNLLTDLTISLTTKLPFEDDEFDHVHIQSIARGVSENKVFTSVYFAHPLKAHHILSVGHGLRSMFQA